MSQGNEGRQFRLLTAHGIFQALSSSLAGGFVGAYLLRLGFSLPEALSIFAAVLLGRLGLRLVTLPVVRRLGIKRAMIVGSCVATLQYLPLMRADEPIFLIVWVMVVALGESIYWPTYHATTAVSGNGAKRGQQIATRLLANTTISVIGPICGGMLLTFCPAWMTFMAALACGMLSLAPVFLLAPIDAGPVPTIRQSFDIADRLAVIAFSADGWIAAGLLLAWPMVLFLDLHSSFDALGWVVGLASIVGAGAGLLGGRLMDRDYQSHLTHVVTALLTLSIGLRMFSAWLPWLLLPATAIGAAVNGLYSPVLMSVIYARAHRSGGAYRFHVGLEASWDIAAIVGCLLCAAVAWIGLPAAMTVMPALCGVWIFNRCLVAAVNQPAGTPVEDAEATLGFDNTTLG